ncbi:hypothetical protein SK128_003082, partial [Halocaridina rubra]
MALYGLVADVLHCAAESSMGVVGAGHNHDKMGRWERFMRESNDSMVWKAITWKEEYGNSMNNNSNCPTADELRHHFKSVLNLQRAEICNINTITYEGKCSTSYLEIELDKASGPDGISS